MTTTDLVIGTERLDRGTIVVAVEGEIDMSNADRFKQKLLAVLVSSSESVVIDLSGCSFIDSSGLNVLVQAHHAVTGESGQLSLVAAHPHVLRVLEITHIDDVLAVFPDRQSALNADGAARADGGVPRSDWNGDRPRQEPDPIPIRGGNDGHGP